MRYFKDTTDNTYFRIEESKILQLASLQLFIEIKQCDACKVKNEECSDCEFVRLIETDLMDREGNVYSNENGELKIGKPEGIYFNENGERFEPAELEFCVEAVIYSDGISRHLGILVNKYDDIKIQELKEGSDELPDFERKDKPESTFKSFGCLETKYTDGWSKQELTKGSHAIGALWEKV